MANGIPSPWVQQALLAAFALDRRVVLGRCMVASFLIVLLILSQPERICLRRLTLHLLVLFPFVTRLKRLHSTGDINVQQHVKLKGQPPAQSSSTTIKVLLHSTLHKGAFLSASAIPHRNGQQGSLKRLAGCIQGFSVCVCMMNLSAELSTK